MEKFQNEESESSKFGQQWISLARAMGSLVSGKKPRPTGNQPIKYDHFPDSHDFFEDFLGVLHSGKISSRGKLSLVEIKRQAFDKLNSNEARDENEYREPIRMKLRRDESFVIGSGSEAIFSTIESEYWDESLPIWEKSMLWVADQDLHPGCRVSALKVETFDPSNAGHPYELELIICFTEVQVSFSDFKSWDEDRKEKIATPAEPLNSRNAGRKTSHHLLAIEEWLEAEIDRGATWENWMDVWGAACDAIDPKHYELNNGIKPVNEDNVYRKLQRHLSQHNHALLERLKQRIIAITPSNKED